MIRLVFFTLLLLTAGGLRAQNLVPNPSFEEYLQCPTQIDDFDGYVQGWSKASYGSSDYFSACAPSSSDTGVPNNFLGFESARTGTAYAGIVCYNDDGYREYLEAQLVTPLEADTVYYVEFFVSQSDIKKTATSRIGINFSPATLYQSTYIHITTVPQVSNPIDSFLNDTVGWTKVSGIFIAQGGEQFITIGNFYPNSQTPIIGNTQPLPTNFAYYYIDDVTVSKCSTFGLSVNGLVGNKKQQFTAYPNPAHGTVTLDYRFNAAHRYSVAIAELSGRVVYEDVVKQDGPLVDISSLANGAYLVHLSENGRSVGHTKLVVLH